MSIRRILTEKGASGGSERDQIVLRKLINVKTTRNEPLSNVKKGDGFIVVLELTAILIQDIELKSLKVQNSRNEYLEEMICGWLDKGYQISFGSCVVG